MNLFQNVLKGLSDDLGSVKAIASMAVKSPKSVEAEIKRLKQTSWIKRWIKYDHRTGSVRLASPLVGIGYEALEYMVKQFYKSDRASGKEFDAHQGQKVSYDGLSSFVDQIDVYLNQQHESNKKGKGLADGVLTI